MIVDVDRHGEFRLDEAFLSGYCHRPVPWGFGALSWVTFKRTYSRDGEDWWQTCRRVIEGMCTVQRAHCLAHHRPWDEQRAQQSAQDAYDRLFHFKWTPPGRGLWIMGTRFMYERGGAALNNCGFISTRDLARDFAGPFVWMLKMSMLGVGVGFDTYGKEKVTIQPANRGDDTHVIDDSREGWCEALGRVLRACVGEGTLPAQWDYSRIRPAGAPLRGFGGRASGPAPLQQMLEVLEQLYASYENQKVDSRLIVDTMNIVGRCVVAGGIRRSAQIAFGEANDTQFLDLKLDSKKLHDYRWVSNNSVLAEVGMDYAPITQRTGINGEPGYLWLDNARAFSRMKDPADWKDDQAAGSNPCVEQTLWNRELCCLVETFPAHHDSLADYKQTLRLAYQYAKTVTLVLTEDEKTNDVMQRNRRIGCSMTGVVQAINRHGYRNIINWCDHAYDYVQHIDQKYADWLHVPRSIKTTSVKPSGTVSLLAGATAGVHWEHAPYYIRRMRVAENHPLVEMCRRAGYDMEPDAYSSNSMVISFPVHTAHLQRAKAEVPLREKVDLAAQLQRYWSDNQVSCTAEFDPEHERDDLTRVLESYEDRLKAMVFLPSAKHGYEQPPYEAITRQQYEHAVKKLEPIQGEIGHEHQLEARFCDGDVCELP